MDPYDAGLDEDDEEQHAKMLARLFGQPGVTKSAAMIAALRGQEEHQRKGIAAIPQAQTPTQQTQQPQAPQQSVQGSMLPQTLTQPGNPYAGRASALEAQRPQAQAALDAATRLPDTGEVEAFGRKRGEAANRHLITALAAHEAGDEFKPFSAHYLAQAAEAQKPMKMTAGVLTDQGYVADVGYQASIEAKKAEANIQSIDKALENTLTLEQRERLEEAKLKQAAIIARERMANSRGNAEIMAGAIRPLSDKARGELDEADAVQQGLSGAIAALEAAPDKGTGWGAGAVTNFVPGGQSLVSGKRDPALNSAIQQLTYVTGGIQHGRFGASLTQSEKASAAQYLPSEYDTKEQMLAKARGLQGLLDLNNRRLREREAKLPGGAPPAASRAPAAAPAAPAASGKGGGATGSWDAPSAGGGRIARNPKTGERLQLVNGKWTPL